MLNTFRNLIRKIYERKEKKKQVFKFFIFSKLFIEILTRKNLLIFGLVI